MDEISNGFPIYNINLPELDYRPFDVDVFYAPNKRARIFYSPIQIIDEDIIYNILDELQLKSFINFGLTSKFLYKIVSSILDKNKIAILKFLCKKKVNISNIYGSGHRYRQLSPFYKSTSKILDKLPGKSDISIDIKYNNLLSEISPCVLADVGWTFLQNTLGDKGRKCISVKNINRIFNARIKYKKVLSMSKKKLNKIMDFYKEEDNIDYLYRVLLHYYIAILPLDNVLYIFKRKESCLFEYGKLILKNISYDISHRSDSDIHKDKLEILFFILEKIKLTEKIQDILLIKINDKPFIVSYIEYLYTDIHLPTNIDYSIINIIESFVLSHHDKFQQIQVILMRLIIKIISNTKLLLIENKTNLIKFYTICTKLILKIVYFNIGNRTSIFYKSKNRLQYPAKFLIDFFKFFNQCKFTNVVPNIIYYHKYINTRNRFVGKALDEIMDTDKTVIKLIRNDLVKKYIF